MPAIRTSRKAALLIGLPLIAGLGGCNEHFGAPHGVVNGHSTSVFADPVGYAYPDIKSRTKALGYKPLPTPAQRPLGVDMPPVTQPPSPAPTPKTPRKQSALTPKPVAAGAIEAAKPVAEIVPRQDLSEGRATTQNRR